MISTLLFVLSFVTPPQVKSFQINDVFAKIDHAQIASDSNHAFFFLDKDNFTVHKYDFNGTKLLSFGKKGEGPGEFQRPIEVFAMGQHVYVRDNFHFSVFREDGTYLKKITAPPQIEIKKTTDGWLFSDWNYSQLWERHGGLFKVNHDFEEQQSLLELVPQGESRPDPDLPWINVTKPVPFNPAAEQQPWAISKEGLIFVRHRTPILKISVLDQNGTLLRTLKKKVPLVPFNQSWGEQLLSEKKSPHFKYTANFPEFFPSAAAMMVHGNHIFLSHWNGKNPDASGALTVLDFNGNEVSSPLTADALAHLVSYQHNQYMFLVYHEEESKAVITICPEKDLKGYIQSNPFPAP